MFKILKPKGNIYQIAAKEFIKYAKLITGISPEIIYEDDGVSDLVVLGSDAENEYVAQKIIDGDFEGFNFRYGTDDFSIQSAIINNRKHLFIAGGRSRSLMYAIYTYFEKVCGCRWFWDGDIIKKAEILPIENIHITESPQFLYRGLRYFAHRGLDRFQAEMWGYNDWTREIDWMLKKKLNIFMLRIGNDDIFQKAFPDIVPYPSNDTRENKTEYNDRTTPWSLKYRGELRKKILDYAFERDLMHPEDFGTTTHWYTPTPQEFLDKVNPEFFSNISDGYNEKDMLVWNIRKDRNLDNYLKLTDTHVKEYGRGELFHTIGFAERLFSSDKTMNLRMKLYAYRKTMNRIFQKYPMAKLLLASWDLTGYYSPDEVRKLVDELDPERTIIWDYTSDTLYENNFTKWDIVGKFPYVFGIFGAYCSHSGALGRYDIIEERLNIAKNDKFCKGMIFWPELSHGDSMMIEYFANNSWNPLEKDLSSSLNTFCNDRYTECTEEMKKVYSLFMPFIPLLSWDWHPLEIFCNPTFIMKWVWEDSSKIGSQEYKRKEDIINLKDNAVAIFDILMNIKTDNKYIIRDMYDIARVVVARYLQIALHEVIIELYKFKKDGSKPDEALKLLEKSIELAKLMTELLSQHRDYSLSSTYEKLYDEAPVNPQFDRTLKENASCEYNRTQVYEHFKYLYVPEMEIAQKWAKDCAVHNEIKDISPYMEQIEDIRKTYLDTPFKDMKNITDKNTEVMENIVQTIKNLF